MTDDAKVKRMSTNIGCISDNCENKRDPKLPFISKIQAHLSTWQCPSLLSWIVLWSQVLTKSILRDHDGTYCKYFLFCSKLSFLVWKQIPWHGMVNWLTNCSLWTHTYFQYLFQVSGLFDGWYWGRRIAYLNKIQEHRLTQWQGKAMQWSDLGPIKYK